MQHVNGVPIHDSDPALEYDGLEGEPTWFSAQGGVYKCIDRKTHRRIAIKKYLVEENKHRDMFVMPKELIENEIYTMTKCVHSNILKLLAVYIYEDFVYLVMPLCTGGSLQQYVFDHQHLSIGQLAYIISSIASGLAEVHGHGYIHRDIKCDNIFLDADTNSIVIGDFGVVSITPAADSKAEEAGVVLFWSPELVMQRIVNRKVDIWALGIVILEILNGGRAPYEDEKLDEEEIKQKILEAGRPAYPSGLPWRLVSLLDQCLEPDPRKRLSASDILQHPFLLHYQQEPLFSIPIPAPDTGHPLKENPRILDDSVENALQKLKALQESHDAATDFAPSQHPTPDTMMSSEEPNTVPTPPAPPQMLQPRRTMQRHVPSGPRKCRLPQPSFLLVDRDRAIAVPSQERIANVIRKRQSMTEMSRNQGSRLPLLIASPIPDRESLSQSLPPPPSALLQRRALRPIQPLHTVMEQGQRKPPSLGIQKSLDKLALPSPGMIPRRIRPPQSARDSSFPVVPAGASKSSRALSPLNAKPVRTPTTPLTATRSRQRSPTSRVARLALGISTTGRHYSTRMSSDQPESPTHRRTAVSPPMDENASVKRERKPRPMSFAGNQHHLTFQHTISSANKAFPATPRRIPPPSSRWQPPPTRHTSKEPPNASRSTSKKNESTSFKGAKSVRVH